MHWNTHDRLSGMMRPYADPNVIYRVNRAMDNPDPWSIRLNESMKNSGYSHAFDVRGLKRSCKDYYHHHQGSILAASGPGSRHEGIRPKENALAEKCGVKSGP
jgi:uncharacterized ParB-like nuclease family protein